MASRSKSSDTEDAQRNAAALPLVFISHDSRDSDVAEAFEQLVAGASAGMLRTFRSSDRGGTSGIEFGEEWFKIVSDRLSEASDVVALLTDRSIGRPWILYEVGVARGKLGVRAFGLAVGTPLERVLTGPFAQLHNSADDEESLVKLVRQLVTRIPGANPTDSSLRMQVHQFRERLKHISGRSTAVMPAETFESTILRLFQEIREMIADLAASPDRVDDAQAILFRQMLSAIIINRRAVATLKRAKEIRPALERIIAAGKDPDTVPTLRELARLLTQDAIDVLRHEVWPQFQNTPGGYSRIIKVGSRRGDRAEMAIIELIDPSVTTVTPDDRSGPPLTKESTTPRRSRKPPA